MDATPPPPTAAAEAAARGSPLRSITHAYLEDGVEHELPQLPHRLVGPHDHQAHAAGGGGAVYVVGRLIDRPSKKVSQPPPQTPPPSHSPVRVVELRDELLQLEYVGHVAQHQHVPRPPLYRARPRNEPPKAHGWKVKVSCFSFDWLRAMYQLSSSPPCCCWWAGGGARGSGTGSGWRAPV